MKLMRSSGDAGFKGRVGILEVGYDRKRRSSYDFKASGTHYQIGSMGERDLRKKDPKFVI